MSIDFATGLGLVGVLLTVAFFVVGYRQTIGARKERARAANRQVVEALFRRLVLDSNFPIALPGIIKLLAGSALEAKVRTADLHSPEDLEAVLYTKVVESDYLTSEQRIEVMDRIVSCFKEDREPILVEQEPSAKNVLPADIWLALTSALLAMLTLSVAALFTNSTFAEILQKMELKALSATLTGVAVLVTLTAAVLTFYTRLRETTRSTDDPHVIDPRTALDYELSLLAEAKRKNASVTRPATEDYDFHFSTPEGKIAVDIKLDANRIPKASLRKRIAILHKRCADGEFSGALIVSRRRPSSEIYKMETSNVKFCSPARLLAKLSSSDIDGRGEQDDVSKDEGDIT